MYLKINGVDITRLVQYGGFKWSRNDVDGSNAGRTMDGTMHRDRVDIKYRLDITCMPMSQADSEMLLALIEPEFVEVETISPRHGVVIWMMYSNNVPATHSRTNEDGTESWYGITFPLIQQ